MGNRLGSDTSLLRQDLFGGGRIDFDRQARDERAHAASAGENHRAGDKEFHAYLTFP